MIRESEMWYYFLCRDRNWVNRCLYIIFKWMLIDKKGKWIVYEVVWFCCVFYILSFEVGVVFRERDRDFLFRVIVVI